MTKNRIKPGDVLILGDGTKTKASFIYNNGRIKVLGLDASICHKDIKYIVHQREYNVGDMIMLDAGMANYIRDYQVICEIRLHPERRYTIVSSLECPNSKNICYNIKSENGDRYLNLVNPAYFKPRSCVLAK